MPLHSTKFGYIPTSVDGVHGIQTQDPRMADVDKSTEIWQAPLPHMKIVIVEFNVQTFRTTSLRLSRGKAISKLLVVFMMQISVVLNM